MNRLLAALVGMVVGAVVLVAAAPTLVCLARGLVPLVVVGSVVAAVLRVVWFYTRGW